MKYSIILAALGLVSSIKLAKDDDEYPHWMNGFGGYHTYVRDVPNRFEEESDDRLMHSLYT